jgi:hypothetical protein
MLYGTKSHSATLVMNKFCPHGTCISFHNLVLAMSNQYHEVGTDIKTPLVGNMNKQVITQLKQAPAETVEKIVSK